MLDVVSTGTALSLRARKRSETWAALHEAALGMALRHDELQQVTVEAIAEAANVSTRTFFNYFRCKEDAVLGIQEPTVDEAAAARFADLGDDELLENVVRLMFDVAYGGSLGSEESRHRRREAVLRHPELSRRQMSHIMQAERLVVEVVANGLRTSPRWRTLGRDVEETAHLIVMVAGAAIRSAVRHLMVSADQDEDAALQRAVSVFREVARKI